MLQLDSVRDLNKGFQFEWTSICRIIVSFLLLPNSKHRQTVFFVDFNLR